MKTELATKKEIIRVLQKTKSCLENELYSSQAALEKQLSSNSWSSSQRQSELEVQVEELRTKGKEYKNRIYHAEMASAKLLRRAQNAEKKLYTLSKISPW